MQAWDLMVFYLEHEFRGSEDNLESFLDSDVRKEQLMKDICLFYWSERAFLLKCIGIYLAYWQDKEHPFSVSTYNNYLQYFLLLHFKYS